MLLENKNDRRRKVLKGSLNFCQCDDLINNHTKSNEWCEPLWDTKLCWPTAWVGETLEMPCPDQEYDHQTAERTCVLYDVPGDSTPRTLWTMANYSLCANPENYAGLVFTIARNKFIQISDQTWESKLLTLSQFVYFLSLVVLVVALSVFGMFPKLRNARTRLHMNMLMSMILQSITWLIHSVLFDSQLISAHTYLDVLSKINIQNAQKFSSDFQNIAEQMFTRLTSYLGYIVIAGLERYFETATLFWLLMEGWFLHEIICMKPLEVQTSIRRYVAIGWGLPVIATSPWMISHLYAPFNDVYWVKHDFTVYIIAIIIFLTFMVNIIFFLRIIKVLYVKIKTSFRLQQKKMEYKKWVRSTFMLLLLFGVQNLLYCAWFFVDETKPKIMFLLYIKVVSSFQGIIVSFIYCFLNKEVRETLKKNLC